MPKLAIPPEQLAALQAEIPAEDPIATFSGPAMKKLKRKLRKAKRTKVKSTEYISEIALAKLVLAKLLQEQQLKYCENTLWVCREDTVWEELDPNLIEREIEKLDGLKINKQKVKLTNFAVKGILESIFRNLYDPTFFSCTPKGVLVRNGFLELDKKFALVEPSPEYACRWRLNLEYDPKRCKEKWIKFLNHVWKGDPDIEGKILCLQEFTGAALAQRGTQFGKVLTLVGDGANGKSTVAEILGMLFPRTTAVTPHHWGKETYLALLRDAPLNLCNELSDSPILSSETFKAVVTGEEITALALYKSPFTFRSFCSHIFATNTLPATKDISTGFWRRLLILGFNNDFSGEGRTKEDVLQELTPLLPEILTWAIDGLKRLISQGKYTIPESGAQELDEWRLESDSVAHWLTEKGYTHTAPSVGEYKIKYCKARPFYFSYKKEILDEGRVPVSEIKFCKRLKKLGFIKSVTSKAKVYTVCVKE